MLMTDTYDWNQCQILVLKVRITRKYQENAGRVGREPPLSSVLARSGRSGPFLVRREEAIFHCYPKLYTQTHAEKNISPSLHTGHDNQFGAQTNCHKLG